MIDETILAGPNLLEQLTETFTEAATEGTDELNRWVLALRSAAALTYQTRRAYATGLKREDRNALGKALTASGIDLEVLAGKSALHGPALMAACLPLFAPRPSNRHMRKHRSIAERRRLIPAPPSDLKPRSARSCSD